MGAMGNRVLVLAVLCLSATAYAQAPGEMAPMDQPPPPPCVGEVHESVMANRWAIGLGIGGLGLAPENQPDAKTDFSIGQLSLRYRASLHLELELAVGGGREKLSDGTQGDLEARTAVLGLRYRFAPEEKWNWWLMGGIGGVSIASAEATDQQRKDAERGLFELGIGLERRFHHFALDAELRAVGVAAPKNATTSPPVMAEPGGTVPVSMPAPTMPSDKLSGGQLTIGASYYF